MNLNIRTGNRRFTRLTNAFSKKVENHAASLAIYFFHYNFCRSHKSLKGRTPAQVAGITDEAFTMEHLVRLMDARTEKPNRPTMYRKRDEAAEISK
jgi:hypothetical protein